VVIVAIQAYVFENVNVCVSFSFSFFVYQMDGVGSTKGGVLVLGATNVPWELDPGMFYMCVRMRVRKSVWLVYCSEKCV
jgi:hypothetical protein